MSDRQNDMHSQVKEAAEVEECGVMFASLSMVGSRAALHYITTLCACHKIFNNWQMKMVMGTRSFQIPYTKSSSSSVFMDDKRASLGC